MQTTVQSVISTRARVANTQDETRVFDVTATVTKTEYPSNVMNDGTDGNIANGVVCEKDSTKQMAQFYSNNDSNLNITYFVSDKEQRASILTEVETFVSAVREFINNAMVTITEQEV